MRSDVGGRLEVDRLEQHIKHVVTWLQQQVSEAKADGLVVGLSGGVDSAVVSFLIKEACPDHSLAAIMPCHSQREDVDDALKVVEACRIDYVVIDLSASHHSLLSTVRERLAGRGQQTPERERTVDGNLRARLRMATLYAIAGRLNYLVAGTDNLAEWYTGYFTKYGDGGVDLLPIARLPKREVYRWAKYFGVPSSILQKKPSAGLWEGQEDETEMGISYDRIDDYLTGKSIPEKDRRRLEVLHRQTAHKRRPPPMPPDPLFDSSC